MIRYAGDSTGVTGGTATTGTGSAAGYTIQQFTTAGTFTFSVDLNSRLGATLSNGISGTGDFTYNGPGALTLAADSSYVGGTIITAGTLRVGDGGTSGSLGSGAVTNNGLLVFNRSDAVAFADQITGTGSVIQQGGGTLTLSGTNSYSGGTTLSAGMLALGSADAIGSTGTISFDGGTLQFSASNTTDYSPRFSTAAGQLYAIDTNGQNVALATALTSSGGSLTKSGAGTLTLGGSNTYSGGTTLAGGVVALGSAGAIGSSGTISFTGGTLQYSASNTTDYSSRFSTGAGQLYAIDTNGENVTLATALTSSGSSLSKSGLGTLTLGGANAYSGGTTVSAGRLTGTTASLQGAITNDAAVEFAQATDGTYSGAMSGSGSLTKSGAGAVTLSGTNSYSGGTTVSAGTLVGTTDSLQGAITNNAAVTFDQASGGTYAGTMSGSGSLTKSDAGTVTLSGANTYSGSTTISAGTLQVGNGGTAGDLGGSGSIANDGTLAFNRSDAVTLARAITGTGGLVQQGSGNLILSATNAYSGATSVTGGRLSVNGALGNTAVTVATGGTLGGSGSITGTLTMQSGGTLAPGNSIESLSAGTTAFAGGATFAYEVNSAAALASAADLLVVNGDLNLSTDVNNLSLLSFVDIAGTPAAFAEDSTVFAMINYTGAWNGGLFSYGGTALADGSRFSVGSQQWEIDYNYTYDTVSQSTIQPLNFRSDYAPASGTQTFVTITAVPEPATLVLVAAGIAGLDVLRRARCPSPLS